MGKPFVGNIINAFADPVEVAIYGGSFVTGEWVSVLQQELIFPCSIQEMSGKDISFLPEGTRIQEHRKLYSQKPLAVNPLDDSNGINEVLFKIGQEIYRLIATPTWYQDYSIYIIKQLQSGIKFPTSSKVRITEDGIVRITEDGKIRITE